MADNKSSAKVIADRYFFRNQIKQPLNVSIRITSTYLVVGSLWILLSDRILGFIDIDREHMTFISMIKGWSFVAITGGLIFYLIYSSLKTIKATEEDLHHLAYYDQLTGLHNRLSINKYLNELIEDKKDNNFALLYVDVDNFKYINDTMGHTFGDFLLTMISDRLIQFQDDKCKVYRAGGDEFVLLLQDFDRVEELELLSMEILKAFYSSFVVHSSSIYVSVSVGISIYPDHGSSIDELLKFADIAVYKAKETGKNRVVFFNKPMNEALSEWVLIEKHLRSALEKNEFELHYQPQLDINKNKISGFEALIRWHNPELGFVSPAKFIEIAEDTHLIIPIGYWVLRNACLFLNRIHKQGYEDLEVSVNISMLQLLQEDFVERVLEILEITKLNPRFLELEITESILMESYEAIEGKLMLLKSRGIKIALDDFGKGYSSLNYLKQLPISTLKIDKTFIDTIAADSNNKSLTNYIVKIGKSMDLCVVAEGVETTEQLHYLVKHNCNKIQGYLFSKPISEKEVINNLQGDVWSTFINNRN